MEQPKYADIKAVLDEFGDSVGLKLQALGLAKHLSPIFKPFSIAVLQDNAKVLVGFGPAHGMAQQTWLDQPGELYAPQAMVDLLENRLGWEVSAVAVMPLPNDPRRSLIIEAAATKHVGEIETMNTLSQIGDIEHVKHLEGDLRRFLEDHPDPNRNVFIMMRFSDTPQMKQIHEAIVTGLREHGMNPVRADDRDYTGELWSNIEVYLTGCKYGIAVFEDIDQRDFNPNVSLELGYLMGRGKRTLLLKEKRLPKIPSDVVHRLYKEFDGYDIDASIRREVGSWINRDLRL